MFCQETGVKLANFFSLCVVTTGLLIFTSGARAIASTDPVEFGVDLRAPAAQLDSRFLSFSIDTSLFLGMGFWGTYQPVELKNDKLRYLAHALAPAFLRVGGTDADRTFYGFGPDEGRPYPKSFQAAMLPADWDQLHEFLNATGTELFFTVNAGPGPRDSEGNWDASQFRALLKYTQDRGYQVGAWELGNELNAYWHAHGWSAQVSAGQYARDYALAKRTLKEFFPEARLGGPASAFWPVIGEPIWPFTSILEDFLKVSRIPVDLITWHFYPTESERCGLATRSATAENFMKVKTYDEFSRWASEVLGMRDRHQPQAEVWLGESGPAQCGGQPGLSDRFLSGLWWLDELGQAAAQGIPVVVRQSLVGSDYGLLRGAELDPAPDYWNSLLWKKLMGKIVLKTSVPDGPKSARVYAHCAARGAPGSVALLLINLSKKNSREFVMEGGRKGLWQEWSLTAAHPLSQDIRLNGAILTLTGKNRDQLPELAPRVHQESEVRLTLAPFSASFVVLPEAGATLCSNK
jgi:heparanase 1